MNKPPRSVVAYCTSAMLTTALAIRGVILLAVPCVYLVSSAIIALVQYHQEVTVSNAASPGRHLLAKWLDGTEDELNCTPAAILDFPEDVFTDTERRQGAAVLHAFLALYLFILLAFVCDDYFVPAIERIIEVLHVSDDVGGATLMAAATSSPELFINVVGTFVTEGDLGVGAVLGSAVFNILAVPACCGILASREVSLDWWPMTRDCAVYALSIVWLIICLADELVHWYEALGLVLFYIFYIILMYYNVKVSAWARQLCTCWPPMEVTSSPELAPLLLPHQAVLMSHDEKRDMLVNQNSQLHVNEDSLLTWLKELRPTSPCGVDGASASTTQIEPLITPCAPLGADVEYSQGSSRGDSDKWRDCSPWRVFTAPIRGILWLSIPDCRIYVSMYPFTFIMCVAWIGCTTYVITWMITVLGDTLRIPDSVMGITFLAAGTSVPEAVSSVIVTKQGHGGMGISNSLGSNTFDILLCLGLPWLIKSSMLALSSAPVLLPGILPSNIPNIEQNDRAVRINSHGLEYSAISLLSSTLLLYITFSCYRFRLNRKVGIVCLFLYAIFVIFATLIELNVFFVVNLPSCGR